MSLRAILWVAVSTGEQAADDKASLPIQERDQRAIAASNEWQVVDVLRVPGHSRRYIDIHECAADMERQGINAFTRLLFHLRERDFDVLMCRDGSRFARTQSLHAYVVESVIAANARIYSLADGFIDANNYRMWISMGGYTAAGEVDRLKAHHDMGMKKNAARGLKTGAKPPQFWVEVRDDKGKPIGMKPDRENYQRLFDDFVTVFCDQRRAYNDIALVLYEQFGHADPRTGKPYYASAMHRLLFRPQTWGHAAYNWTGGDSNASYRTINMGWIIGDAPAPEGIEIYPNVLEPVWNEYQQQRIKAELRIRTRELKGRASSRTRYMFSQILVCADCHRTMAATSTKGRKYYRCSPEPLNNAWRTRVSCPNRTFTREQMITDYIRPLLERLRETGAPIIPASDLVLTPVERMQSLSKEIDTAKSQIARLALEMVKQSPEAASVFQAEIDRASERISILRNELQQIATRNAAAASEQAAVNNALDTLRSMTVDEFFAQPTYAVNQWLRNYLQGYRFALRDGEIVGLLPPR